MCYGAIDTKIYKVDEMKSLIHRDRFACEAFVSRFKHWVSEVFTSGDVSLSNIVIFLGSKYFEICQILLWVT